MDRERLIESAKRAISEYDIAKANRVSVAPDRMAILLAEFVAVFEQAHTPTDERTPEFEALEQDLFKHQPLLSMSDGSIAGCQCMDRVFHKRTEDWGTHLAEVFTDLRRTVQDCPSWQRIYEVAREAQEQGIDAAWIADRLTSSPRTVQGESIRVNPDAQIPYVGTTDDFVVNTRAQGGSSIRDHIRALTGLTDAGLTELGGFHGEPTDAQVLAALNAWGNDRTAALDDWHSEKVEAMRAALRAAFNETGENR